MAVTSPGRSLAFRLSANILVVLLAALAILSAFVLYRANVVAYNLAEKSLETRLGQIADSIAMDSDGRPDLRLTEPLQRAFSPINHDNIYIVRSPSLGVTWTSHPELQRIAAGWSVDDDDGRFVSIDDVFPDRQTFYGISRSAGTPYGPFIIFVAQAEERGEFAGYVLWEFMEGAAWVAPLFLLILLGTVVVTIHMSLSPLSQASRSAARIDPRKTNVRLATENLPRELAPLVNAVNGALDRLEAGFIAERHFTANAAHELRTPLAILKARIDKLARAPGAADLKALKEDVDRMARVIGQLLAVARLEMPRPERRILVMNDLIKDVVSTLAPLALARQQNLAATLPPGEVRLRADDKQLLEAVKNLIENAIVHCPPGTGIEVTLQDDGTVLVMDNGPGIPAAVKERIFERFFRTRHGANAATGAGLGLPIARDIARQYGGTVRVEDTPGGGATFILTLTAAAIWAPGGLAPPPVKLS